MHIAKIEGKKVNFTILVYQNSLMMHDGIIDFRKLHVNSFNEARCKMLAIDLGLHGSWQNFICNVSIIL